MPSASRGCLERPFAMRPRNGWGWLVLLILCEPFASATGTSGTPECPCITSPASDGIRQEALRLNLPIGYGTEGCQAYDINSEWCISAGSSGRKHVGTDDMVPRCKQQWCYVDPSTCPVDAAKCAAVGGIQGSADPKHLPWCRSRKMTAAHVIQNISEVYYSYETCGWLNYYTQDPLEKALSGRALYGTAREANLGYSKRTAGGQWTGAFVEFFIETIKTKSNSTTIHITGEWATPASRDRYTDFEFYTACVLDVALGNYDFCIGDFWVTPERQILTDFTPSVGEDRFYLIVPEDKPYDTLSETLAKPFEPFTAEAWGGILGFLAISALIFYVTDHRNDDDYPFAAHDVVSRGFKASYFAFSGFFAGSPSHQASTLPAKIAMVGFLFFILVVLATYTANLASILVGQQSVSDIASIEIAIRANMKICIEEARMTSLQDNYPNAKLVPTSGYENARFMHRRECDCAVMNQGEIDEMYAGQIKDRDCEDLKNGIFSEEESACYLGFDGQTRDDCKLVKVGGIVQSIPIAFPVSKVLADAMQWAVLTGVFESKMKDWLEVFAQDFPASDNQCTAVDDSAESVSLGLDSLLGTLIISLIFLLLGLALSVVEHLLDRDIASLLLGRKQQTGKEESEEEEDDAGIVPGLKNPNLRRASRASNSNAKFSGSRDSQKIDQMHRMFAKMLASLEGQEPYPGRTASGETFMTLHAADSAGTLCPASNVSSPTRADIRARLHHLVVDHNESPRLSSKASEAAGGMPVHFSARPVAATAHVPTDARQSPPEGEWSEWT